MVLVVASDVSTSADLLSAPTASPYSLKYCKRERERERRGKVG